MGTKQSSQEDLRRWIVADRRDMAEQEQQHVADAAGGEAVFSYDPLPPLSAPLPPPSKGGVDRGVDGGSADDAAAPTAALTSQPSDAVAALQAFSEAEVGWMGHPSGQRPPPRDGELTSWDDPRRRLHHLRAEAEKLERELAEEEEAGRGDRLGGGGEDLRAASAELRSRLDALGAGDAAALSAQLRGRQDDLSTRISEDLARLRLEEQGGAAAADAEAAPPSSSSRDLEVQERLRRLEDAVGAAPDGGTPSILERIERAERLARETDPRELDRLASKAKVIRSDLEAAARARAKLSARPGGGGKGAAGSDDARAVAELHGLLTDLDGVSSHLPAIARRLSDLAVLHGSAADFSSRLSAAESALSASEAVLSSVEAAVTSMEANWKENLSVIEKNVERLDQIAKG